MRTYDLGHTPLGAHYDEAANAILASEIAQGARPIFIRAYTGKEVGYFYLVAILIRLIGQPLIAVRLTSAFIGVASVALTYRVARELFAYEEHGGGMWIARGRSVSAIAAAIAAAIQAVNLWAITVSRLGFRAGLQPPFQALTLLFLYRGLRARTFCVRHRPRAWLNWAWAGVCCGLAAYTYLAVRAFPILLALFFLWLLAFVPAQGHGRLRRLGQMGLFALAAVAIFAPLGAFYLRNPEFFATRMGQVSVFSAEVGGDDPWRAFWHAVKVSFGMFTVRGDLNWRFNVAGAPALWPPLGIFFYVGLAIGLWRLFRVDRGPAGGLRKGTYWLLLLWLPVMLLPSILGGGDVEVSLSLRAIGVMPALFCWPALGLVEGANALRRLLVGRTPPAISRHLPAGALVVLLAATGAHIFYQCFNVWGPSVPGYYVASGYLVEAAEFLNAHLPPEADCYISAEHYRHPTMALLARRYADLKWLVGPDVLVFPTQGDRETWYTFTHEAMPPQGTLSRVFGPPDVERLAPDGQTAFRVYRFPPGEVPVPQPEQCGHGPRERGASDGEANLGNVLAFLGYDLNAPLVSGDVLDVTLYWRVLRGTDRDDGYHQGRDDWTFFAHLVDGLGFQWGGKTFFTYPSIQWRTGEVLAFRCAFPTWAGAPPGAYALSVGAFSPSLDARLPVLREGANGTWQMVGTTVHVGPLEVARAPSPPAELPPIQRPLKATFGRALTLLGIDRDRGDLRPGETLALSLYWQATAEVEEAYTVALWLEGRDERVPLWEGDPVHGRYPFTRWQPSEFVRDRYALRTPLDALAGDYDLRLALLRPDGTPLVTSDGGEWVSLGTIHVHASDRLWAPPDYQYPVGARLGDVVELLGYDLDRQEVRPGEAIHLTLVWRCLKEMDVAYTVFTHLLDKGGQIRGQQDNPPLGGRYPTTLWVPGEVVIDEYDIVIQADASPGTHVVEVGMYDPAKMQRLPVLDPTGAVGDRVLLGNLQIGP